MLTGENRPANSSAIPRGAGSALPSWVAFDQQVLCFDAYLQEAVHEKKDQSYAIRICKIYFYLEDDSIQVVEPRTKNSGVPQGKTQNIIFILHIIIILKISYVGRFWFEKLPSPSKYTLR